MACPSEENPSNWVFDYSLLEDIPVPGGDLPSLDSNFHWARTLDDVRPPASLSAKFDNCFGNLNGTKESGSRKRMRLGVCDAPDSKAYKEKVRRDKLNDRFQELSSVIEPGKSPKTDKVVILNDAVNMVIQLREEAQRLQESCNKLQENVKELKVEKNEIREEKTKLKAEKEKLEQQLKALNPPHGFLPHLPPIPPPQAIGSKLVPFVGYPGISMWQLMPPTAFDTSEDHSLRPPVA
ncbi:transcription factor bHLH115-like isoform X1 [Primulina huaijiensis]|uniref:transcription factor bHLH115-like isoform X1 n=1 Tax=Primulina huaijiensis TaxID=1492673 RepID=UPI003CC6FF21